VLWGKQTSSKCMEHTYAQCKEHMQDMDSHTYVSSRDKGVKFQRKYMQGLSTQENA